MFTHTSVGRVNTEGVVNTLHIREIVGRLLQHIHWHRGIRMGTGITAEVHESLSYQLTVAELQH